MAELEQQIRDVEGFDVRLATRGGARSAVIEPYPYDRRAPRGWTCTEWRTRRVEASYPDLLAHVLTANGVVTHGRTRLDIVRNGYGADSDDGERVAGGPHPAAHQARRSFWARFSAPIVAALGMVKLVQALSATDAESLWGRLLASVAQ